jgi:fucose 4-O-acetylase-like acetyltransferase
MTLDRNLITNRSCSADILKGIGVILVVMGHVTHNVSLDNWIYAFHMPLFFLLSGIFFKPTFENWKKSFKRLLIPYIFFAIVSFVYWRFVEMKFRPLPDDFDVNMHVFDIFWQTMEFRFNVVLWFLPCLFIVQSIGWVLFSKVKDWRIALGITIFWLALASLIHCNVKSMWVNESFYAFPFFGVGYLIGKERFISTEEYLRSVSRNIYIVLAILPLIGVWFLNIGNDMQICSYCNGYFLFFIIALVCILCCYVISSKLSMNKWLMWLGINSLAIMCIHEPMKRILIVVFSRILHMEVQAVRESISLSILITCVTIAAIVPVCMFINKKCKWVLGR